MTKYVLDITQNRNPVGGPWDAKLIRWDIKGLRIADFTARENSKDPSTKVGSCIVRADGSVAATGYNGFPRGVKDHKARYDDRTIKYAMVVHSEINCLIHLKEPVEPTWKMYCVVPPCSSCAGAIINSGVKNLVLCEMQQHQLSNSGWRQSVETSHLMFSEANVTIMEYPLWVLDPDWKKMVHPSILLD